MYYTKRILDYMLSVVLLAVLFPLLTIIAILIKVTSKGPVIFKQERLGKDGKVFTIYKFRTMMNNAENLEEGIFLYEEDRRITKLGNLLRKSSLDELPQLFNVLKGEMSFVGPRPPLTHFPYSFEEYSLRQRKRFSVLPGITGYAQINGRNKLSWEEKIELDLEYIIKFNLLLDIKIMFLTVNRIFKRDGIYGGKKSENK